MKYVAIMNMPGYLPDSDDPPPMFDTPTEAWQYHLDDLPEDEAYEPADPSDEGGPWVRSQLALDLERRAEGTYALESVGTVYGPTYAYSVEYAEEDTPGA